MRTGWKQLRRGDHENWEFSTKFRYAIGRSYTPFETSRIQPSDLYNTLRIDANHIVSMYVWIAIGHSALGNWTHI